MERYIYRDTSTEEMFAQMVVSWFTNRHFWGYFELGGRIVAAVPEGLVGAGNQLIDGVAAGRRELAKAW